MPAPFEGCFVDLGFENFKAQLYASINNNRVVSLKGRAETNLDSFQRRAYIHKLRSPEQTQFGSRAKALEQESYGVKYYNTTTIPIGSKKHSQSRFERETALKQTQRLLEQSGPGIIRSKADRDKESSKFEKQKALYERQRRINQLGLPVGAASRTSASKSDALKGQIDKKKSLELSFKHAGGSSLRSQAPSQYDKERDIVERTQRLAHAKVSYSHKAEPSKLDEEISKARVTDQIKHGYKVSSGRSLRGSSPSKLEEEMKHMAQTHRLAKAKVSYEHSKEDSKLEKEIARTKKATEIDLQAKLGSTYSHPDQRTSQYDKEREDVERTHRFAEAKVSYEHTKEPSKLEKAMEQSKKAYDLDIMGRSSTPRTHTPSEFELEKAKAAKTQRIGDSKPIFTHKPQVSELEKEQKRVKRVEELKFLAKGGKTTEPDEE
jgi:hypothetical protein